MTKEQAVFLQVLRDFLHSGTTKINDHNQLNWDELAVYAKNHQVEGIIYYQTKRSEFRIPYYATIAHNENRNSVLNELVLEIGDIPYFIVKGTVIAALYPVPALRTMGDTDVTVHTSDRQKVHNIMLKLGFKNTEKNINREWQYYKNNMEFELHDRLVYEENVNHTKQDRFFSNFWPYVKDNQLDWNVHFIYLLSHLRKHFMNEGAGFRHFLDIAVVSEKVELDWKYIEKILKKIELLSFAKTVLSFNKLWFDVPNPLGMIEFSNDFFENATQKIFKDGIFGFDNEENKSAQQANLYLKKGILGFVLVYIREVFPGYDYLIKSGTYPFLQGKKYLLPLAWIKRFFYTMSHSSSSNGISRLKSKQISKKEIEKRKMIYEGWGIDKKGRM